MRIFPQTIVIHPHMLRQESCKVSQNLYSSPTVIGFQDQGLY